MPKLTVRDLPPLDGEYEADFDIYNLDTTEVRTIKRLSGVRFGEIEEALSAMDMDLFTAFAVVFMVREGKHQRQVEALVEKTKPAQNFEWDFTDLEAEQKEDEDRPPDSQTVSGSESEPDEAPRPSDSSPPSANGSSSSSESSELDLSRIGQLS